MKRAQYYLDGIRNNDTGILNEIYDTCSKQILSYVFKNNGDENDGWDTFQDGLLILYKKVQDPHFQIKSSFSTYLFAICRFVWLQKLNKKSKEEVTFSEFSQLIVEEGVEKQFIEVQRQAIYDKAFDKLSPECQELLRMSFLKIRAKEVAVKMKYSIEYVKKKKI